MFVLTPATSGRLVADISCPDPDCPSVVYVKRDYGNYKAPLDPRYAELKAGVTYLVAISGGSPGRHEYEAEFSLEQPFAYQIGELVTEGSHGDGSGAWTLGGEPDRYRFTIPPGGMDLAAQVSDNLNFQVEDQQGTRYYLYGITHLDEGAYDVVAWPSQYPAAGDYSFRLIQAPPVVNKSLTVGTTSNPAPLTSSLEDLATAHDVTFTIADAGKYTFDLTGEVYLEFLEAPGGDTWIPWSDNQVTLPEGEYRARISAPWGQSFGAFDYTIGVSHARPVDTVQYTLGQTLTSGPGQGVGSLLDRSDLDELSFTIPDPGLDVMVLFDGLDPCEDIDLHLTDHTGEELYPYCRDLDQGISLPPGDYRLTVGLAYGSLTPRDYSIAIASPHTTSSEIRDVGAETFSGAAELTGAIEHAGAVHEYTLDLNQDEATLAPWLEIEPLAGCAPYVVYRDQDVVGRGSCRGWSGYVDQAQYRVVVSGSEDEDYSLIAYLTDEPYWSSGEGL